jgi:hypothetical protein
MQLSEYEAKRAELDAKMQKLNEMESEKKKRSKIIEIKKSGINVIRPRVKLRGRLLRMGIETVNGSGLTIYQGVQIKIENDED